MLDEFLQLLCNFYIVAIAVILPLYVRGTYVMLGDEKYILFRNISLFCLGLGMAATLAKLPARIRKMMNSSDSRALLKWRHISCNRESMQVLLKKSTFSPVDVFMVLYGLAVVISASCSSYGEIAWTGYHEWYMGAVSQLIFVGIYFFVSRCYRGDDWSVLLLEVAFLFVILLGFCSRLGLDPLGLMHEFNSGDWEYSHLISTIGNINWFCGYCAVALAMPVAGYLEGKCLLKTMALYVVSTVGLLLLCIQGCDIGLVLTVACLGVCLVWSRGETEKFRRTLLLAMGVAFGLPCYSRLVWLCGEAALKAQPADGPGMQVFGWSGWWLIGAVCLALYLFLRRMSGTGFWETSGMKEKSMFGETHGVVMQGGLRRETAIVRGLWLGIVVLGVVVTIVGFALYLRHLSGSEAWVNGRGALWYLSLQGFWRGDWKQKLLGAGPDCFAEYIYSMFAPSELFVTEGHWANAIFANAHNQWLNHLVNTGLLGICCAVGVAIAAVRRYHRYLIGALVLALYGVNSMVSFQQVISTPLFFVILGICECRMRMQVQRQ